MSRAALRGLPAAIPLLLAAVALLPFAGACSGTPQAEVTAAEAEALVLPGEYWRDYFFLPLVLGGDPERTLWFLFDTGANVTTVDPGSLRAVSTWRGGAGERVNLIDARCGPVLFERLPARTHELDHLSRALGRQLDGILGYPAFRDFLLTLDYGKAELRLAQGRLGRVDGETIHALRNSGNRRPWVRMHFAGERHTLLVDSGSSGGFQARLDGARWGTEPLPVAVSMGISGPSYRRIGRLDGTARLLGLDFAEPDVELPTDTELFGSRIMRHYVWTFDQRGKRVRVERLTDGPVLPEPFEGTGALVVPHAEGLRIAGLTPGSPAERAGLREGEVVVEVGGVSALQRPEGGFPESRDGGRRFRSYLVAGESGRRTVEVDVVPLVPLPAPPAPTRQGPAPVPAPAAESGA